MILHNLFFQSAYRFFVLHTTLFDLCWWRVSSVRVGFYLFLFPYERVVRACAPRLRRPSKTRSRNAMNRYNIARDHHSPNAFVVGPFTFTFSESSIEDLWERRVGNLLRISLRARRWDLVKTNVVFPYRLTFTAHHQ